MVVYRFSKWCRYFSHCGVGLYCMMLGENVIIGCMYVWVIGRGFSSCLINMIHHNIQGEFQNFQNIVSKTISIPVQ